MSISTSLLVTSPGIRVFVKELTPDLVIEVNKIRSLVSLHVAGAVASTAWSLLDLHSLQELTVDSIHVDYEFARKLRFMHSLRSICLSNIRIQRDLDFEFPHGIQILRLNGCEFDASLLMHLKNLEELEELSITLCQVSGKLLIDLQLPRVKKADFSGSRLDRSVLENLDLKHSLRRLSVQYADVPLDLGGILRSKYPNAEIWDDR